MSFYELFREHYDQLFPASGESLRWVNEQLGNGQSLLDIGCGTGNKTVFLAENRAQVLGLDSDQTMIDYAMQHHAAANITYLVMKIQDIGKNIPPENFDAVTCLGNTIPHLTEQGELFNAMKTIRQTMRRDGVFVGQLLNYDRIISMNITSLPLLETASVIFRRSYEWKDGAMSFKGELEEKAGGGIQYDSIPMQPILKGRLECVLYEAGFELVEFFGGFDGQPYSDQSYNLIFRARNQE